mgnify:CR=1 FL=1
MAENELIGLFDTHAHPTDERFDEDRTEVLARMRQADMLCMCVGADMASSAQSVVLANENENIYAAVGVHPHDAKKFTEADVPQLIEWITQEKKVKALEEELGHIIYTSPLTQYNGALGAALFAYQRYQKEQKG